MTGHLLVVGAGPNQLGMIERAKVAGLTVTATDRDPAAVGFERADHRAIASTRDPEATLAAIAGIHADDPITGVTTIASESGVAVATIAAVLGLPGLDIGASRRATDKALRRETFATHGVPAARFAIAETAAEVVSAGHDLGWPVVVKPVDSAGSRGVRHLDGPAQVAAAVEEIARLSADPRILVEELLVGSEHSVEGIVVDGVVHWTAFSDRNYAEKHRFPPHFFEDGDTLPSALDQTEIGRAFAASAHAVGALRIDHGPVKGDLLITSDGPKVIEMAARLSGDAFCEWTAPLNNRIDLVGAVIDQALGRPIDPARLRPAGDTPIAYRGVWVDADDDASVDIDALGAQYGVLRVRADDTLAAGGRARRIATVHATGADRAEAIANAEAAVATAFVAV